MNYCEVMRKIKENPMAPAPKMTVGQFYALQEHTTTCAECIQIVEEVYEEYKDVKLPPSEWDKTQYN